MKARKTTHYFGSPLMHNSGETSPTQMVQAAFAHWKSIKSNGMESSSVLKVATSIKKDHKLRQEQINGTIPKRKPTSQDPSEYQTGMTSGSNHNNNNSSSNQVSNNRYTAEQILHVNSSHVTH